MKEQALYHLMQLRARQLQESLTSGQRDALSEIRESLHIERSEGGYLLRWRLAGIDYRYRPEHDNFSFYIKGDGKKSSAETADMSGYREVNWRAAYSLWLEIYKISGLDVDILHESDALAFSKRTALPDRKTLSIDLIAAALFAAAAGLYVDINTGLQVLLCTFIMLRLAGCFEHVHLRHRTRLSEKVIIAAGTLTPILFGAGLIGLIPLLLAMYLVCLAERSGNTYWFIGSGVVFALAIPYLLWVAATIFICLLVLMRLLTLVDKQRLRLNSVYSFSFGFIVVLLVLTALVNQQWIMIPNTAPPMLHTELSSLLGLSLLGLSGLIAMAWWISGVQYYLAPWFVLIALFVGQFVLLLSGHQTEVVSLTALSGLQLFLLFRVLAGFIPGRASTGKE